MEQLIEILQYPFMQRAIISGIALAGTLAFFGVFVVLRKMAFFSDGIAHASLAGIAIGIIASFNPFFSALLLSVVFGLLIFFLEKKKYFTSDTAIGILFTTGMALGVFLLSFKEGYQPELISFLFGNILSITQDEMFFVLGGSLLIIFFLSFLFKKISLLSFDLETAHLSGIKKDIIQPLFYVALSVSVVLGIKALGIILVSALLIIPVAGMKHLSSSLKSLTVKSIIFSEVMVILGIFISYLGDFPTGPTIVLTGTALFVLSFLFRSGKI